MKYRTEIEVFLITVSGVCLISGLLHMAPESVGTAQGRSQARLCIGVLTILCIPALVWVRRLIRKSEK